jgi:signal transduction histidine kinase
LQGTDTLPHSAGSLTGSAIAEGRTLHVHDIAEERDLYPVSWQVAQQYGHHSMLAVPLTREGKAFGAMFLRRGEVRPFSDKQIALGKTFADQAAIAIENVRLFNETKEALDQQTATSEILRTISSSPSELAGVFKAILANATSLCEAAYGVLWQREGDAFRMAALHGALPADQWRTGMLVRPSPDVPLARVVQTRKSVHVVDMRTDHGYLSGAALPVAAVEVAGMRTLLLVPMLKENEVIGEVAIYRTEVRAFTDRQIALIENFADQAVIAIENVRLFKEIQEKSAQLEVANKHKSDFLANMSHELRTPLNAIIGFSEVLSERMFGEINEKQADYLKDIHESGKHLLSLINDILDLSKIEAGRMDLELSSFHLPTALSNAMTLVRERAQRHGIELGLDVDRRLAEFSADERKFKQIMVNLLSNAVKFTPDGGRVDVSVKLNGKAVEIAVKDTGIGIAPEDQQKIFAEFVQVGRDYTRKAEGTGLGLALTKRFVELHGGEIRLASTPGKGSTFTFTIPIRP